MVNYERKQDEESAEFLSSSDNEAFEKEVGSHLEWNGIQDLWRELHYILTCNSVVS